LRTTLYEGIVDGVKSGMAIFMDLETHIEYVVEYLGKTRDLEAMRESSYFLTRKDSYLIELWFTREA